ncbi:MAG: hypothetical protein DPW18_16355 [Chloroflexi bacterium]|nr:hypothetical protein [Chloroflexota bacterium]MDL1943081.1 hypothetical protein [Chloroflexi bacterium CFX2]
MSDAFQYPVPVHLQPAYANLNSMAGSLSKSERAAREAVSLPLYPEMMEEQVRRVSRVIREFMQHARDSISRWGARNFLRQRGKNIWNYSSR